MGDLSYEVPREKGQLGGRLASYERALRGRFCPWGACRMKRPGRKACWAESGLHTKGRGGPVWLAEGLSYEVPEEKCLLG